MTEYITISLYLRPWYACAVEVWFKMPLKWFKDEVK